MKNKTKKLDSKVKKNHDNLNVTDTEVHKSQKTVAKKLKELIESDQELKKETKKLDSEVDKHHPKRKLTLYFESLVPDTNGRIQDSVSGAVG